MKYKLVNPLIIGTFNDVYSSENADGAAKVFWETLTSNNNYITGNIPKFMFTLMDTNSKDLHHYVVKEKPDGQLADYTITKIDYTVPAEKRTEFMRELGKVKKMGKKVAVQDGGSHRKRYNDVNDDDDSSSDEDVDDLFRYLRLKKTVKPIVYWWYNPTLYNDPTVFVPTFIAPLSPYTQLWVPIR